MEEPIFFRVEGIRFGQVERWPIHNTRESAEQECDRLRDCSDVSWVFKVTEAKTDA